MLMPVDEKRRRTWCLALCLLIALAVRLLALQQFSSVERFHGDEGAYQKTATQILEGRGHPGSLRPPAYPFFIAAVYTAFGKSPLALRIAQILVSLAAVLAVFRITAARYGTRAATLSGLTCALAPSLVHYTHFLWSECLATTLLILFFWALDGYDRTQRSGLMALAGVLLGISALTRETWAFFGVIVVLWMLWRHRPHWREALLPAGVFIGCMALAVLPWTIRNYVVHDNFVLISTGRWYPIAQGNSLNEDDWLLGTVRMKEAREEVSHLDEFEQDRYWRPIALAAIRAEQPGWLFKKIVRNTSLLFQVRSQSVRYIERGWIETRPWRAYTILATSVAGHLLITALGLVALWLVPGGWLKRVAVTAILYTLGVHVIAIASSRYLVPLMPLFALYVGPLLAGRERMVSRDRLIGATLVLLAFAGAVIIRWGHDLGPALDAVNAISGGS